MKIFLFVGVAMLSGAGFAQGGTNNEALNDSVRTDFIEKVKERIQDSVFMRSLLITPEILRDVPEGVDKEDYLKELDKWIVVYDKWNYLTQMSITKLGQCGTVSAEFERYGITKTHSKYLNVSGIISFKCDEETMVYDVKLLKFNGFYYIENIYQEYPHKFINTNYDQRGR